MKSALIEVNGASLTMEVIDENITGEMAKEEIEGIVKNIGLKQYKVLLYYCSRKPRITVRTKGNPAEMRNFEDAIKNTNRFSVIRNKSLSL